jgi:hypothetical protein
MRIGPTLERISVPTLLSLSPWRTVHDINVMTRNDRRFIIDLYRDDKGVYETTVTAYELGNSAGWVFIIRSLATSSEEQFRAALEWIQNYLKQVDPSDVIIDMHNPRNCPFVSQPDQQRIASGLSIVAPIRVN